MHTPPLSPHNPPNRPMSPAHTTAAHPRPLPPQSLQVPGLVRTDMYWSMWSCEDIPCPWSSSLPTCRIKLLHHEQMKIPENLARFAIKQGMWGLVRKIAPAFAVFVAERRARVDPNAMDPCAYGCDGNRDNMYAVERTSSDASSQAAARGMPADFATGGQKRRLRKVASALLLASGCVLAMSQGSGGTSRKGPSKRKLGPALPSAA